MLIIKSYREGPSLTHFRNSVFKEEEFSPTLEDFFNCIFCYSWHQTNIFCFDWDLKSNLAPVLETCAWLIAEIRGIFDKIGFLNKHQIGVFILDNVYEKTTLEAIWGNLSYKKFCKTFILQESMVNGRKHYLSGKYDLV